MRQRETISARQMSILYLAFASGSAIIYIPAPLTEFAENAGWISLLLAGTCGFLLLACILYLNRKYPGLTYIEYSRAALGKWLTVPIALSFLLMAMLMISYIVIGIGSFFTTTLMKETPNYVFNFLVLMTAAFTAKAGIENMARMFNLLQFLVVIMIIGILVLVSPFYHVVNLMPILPAAGLKPIFHGMYFTFGFPFGEVCLFAMLLPLVAKKHNKKLTKWMIFAFISTLIIFLFAVVCTILAVGPLSVEFKYSLYELARLISIGDFIERVESVSGLVLTLGSYMKATIALYILSLALSKTIGIDDSRIFVFPLAFVSFFLTLVMFKNEGQFVEKVTVVWPLIIFLSVVTPVLLITCVTMVKGMLKKS